MSLKKQLGDLANQLLILARQVDAMSKGIPVETVPTRAPLPTPPPNSRQRAYIGRKAWTEELEARIVALAREGQSFAEIAEVEGRRLNSVRARLYILLPPAEYRQVARNSRLAKLQAVTLVPSRNTVPT